MFRILRAKNSVRRLVEIGDGAAFAHGFRVVANCKFTPTRSPLASWSAEITSYSVVPGETVLRNTITWMGSFQLQGRANFVRHLFHIRNSGG